MASESIAAVFESISWVATAFEPDHEALQPTLASWLPVFMKLMLLPARPVFAADTPRQNCSACSTADLPLPLVPVVHNIPRVVPVDKHNEDWQQTCSEVKAVFHSITCKASSIRTRDECHMRPNIHLQPNMAVMTFGFKVGLAVAWPIRQMSCIRTPLTQHTVQDVP